VTLAVTGVLFGVALFRFDLLGLLPATQTLGRRAAIEDVGVGLVVVDTDGRVVEFNAAAEPVLGIDSHDGGPRDADARSADSVAGDPLDSLVDGVNLAADDPQRIEVTDGADYRVYEATTSPIGDHTDRTVGYTVSFADVTARELRRQRLEVLNRALRHNLRNDMTVVVGNADLLGERVADDHRALADAVSRRGRALQRLGEKARDAEAVLADDTAPRDVSVTSVCDDLVRRARESFPDADVAASVPDGLTVTARVTVLDTVLWNLVENALDHGDDPSVRLAATDMGDGVEFVVADDGPGIPTAELEAIRSRTEPDLSHGSGLGLWIVRWGTRVLGADLTFEDRGPTGTRVTVTVPRADRDASRPRTGGGGPT
jgi:signal transduction histidine kinase